MSAMSWLLFKAKKAKCRQRSKEERKGTIFVTFHLFLLINLPSMSKSTGLIINEVAFNQQDLSFIEVFSFQDEGSEGKPHYSIVVLQPGSDGKTRGAQVVAIIDLANLIDHPFSMSKYYTIGSPSSQWTQHPVPTNQGIPLVGGGIKAYGMYKSWLDVEDTGLKLVALLKSYDVEISTVLPTDYRRLPFVEKNPNLQAYIRRNMIDALMVRGPQGNTNECGYIDSLVPFLDTRLKATMQPKYWDAPSKYDDAPTSLQRCGVSTLPFMHMDFKYESPSPYRRNPCSMQRYDREENLPTLVVPFGILNDDVCGQSLEDDTQSGLSGEKLDPEAQATKRFKASHTPLPDGASNFVIPENQAGVLNEIALYEINRLEIESKTGAIDTNLLQESNFQKPRAFQEALEFISQKISHLFNVQELDKYSEWFNFLENTAEPEDSRFNCKVCSSLLNHYGIKERSDLSKVEGVRKRNLAENMQALKHHNELETHKSVMAYYRTDVAYAKEHALAQIQDSMASPAHLKTISNLKTAFQEAVLKLAYTVHPGLVDLQIENQTPNLGISCREEHAAKSMQEVIGEMEMENVLVALKAYDGPFSIICDGSSDAADLHIFGCLLQFLHNDVVTVQFWRAMELDDQSGQSHADTVENWMKLDNIWEMAQRHLTSVATDGASNMISQGNAKGTGGGFCKLLSDKIESRDLICLHCMAHQLQLILKNVNNQDDKKRIVPKCNNCVMLEKYFTKFAAFYLNSGPRKTRLRAFCLADNGITCGNDYAPQKTFGIRWVDSHHTANLRIFKNHKLYVSHLKVLEFDPIYKNAPGTRLTIRQFRQFLTHQNVIITLCVQLDIARVYKGISKVFQTKGSSLIGQPALRRQLLLDKDDFWDGKGPYLKKFLEEATCAGKPCMTLEKLRNTVLAPVLWNGIELHQSPPFQMENDDFVNFLYPSDYLDDYIDGINEWLAYYMPADGLMATMNTLDQSSWPMSPQSLTFGEGLSEQMKQWPKHFKFENYSEGDFVIDMTELLNCLETQEDFWTETRKSSPTDFWSALLRSKCKPTSQRLLNLIRATLVCPYGSADAERLFSLMNLIKTDLRNSLSTAHLNHLIAISMSKKTIQTFNFNLAAKKYHEHHRTCDAKPRKHTKPNPLIYPLHPDTQESSTTGLDT